MGVDRQAQDTYKPFHEGRQDFKLRRKAEYSTLEYNLDLLSRDL